MVPEFKVTRAHLKGACDQQNWDLLDKLLEIDSSRINDNALYTDTWGEWWGMLFETVRLGSVDGLKVLLKHGAERNLASCGDPGGNTPLEAARDKPEILALLQASETPAYRRQTDPSLPEHLSPTEMGVNRQGEIRETTGLVFQTDAIDKAD